MDLVLYHIWKRGRRKAVRALIFKLFNMAELLKYFRINHCSTVTGKCGEIEGERIKTPSLEDKFANEMRVKINCSSVLMYYTLTGFK